ncbi:MAG: hypothetical protein ACI4WS_10625 [Oscillospiraceae bacterium]
MKQVDKKVDAIRTNLEKKRPEVYPIKEHPIDGCEEFVKKLYIDMLCVVAQYENEDAENQLKFIQRIHAGAGLTEPITENIKNAMEVTVERFDEFLRQCRENSLENIFIVDCLLTACADGAPNGKQVAFLAEVSEALGIGREHTGWLCDIAIAILEQDTEKYHAACENIPHDKKTPIVESVVCYLKEFVVGVLVDTDEMLWIYAKEKTVLSDELYDQLFDEDGVERNKVKIENIIFPCYRDGIFHFKNIKEIECRFCELLSSSFDFNSIYHISISDCIFDGQQDSYNTFLCLKNITNIDIINSLFKDKIIEYSETFSAIECIDAYGKSVYIEYGTRMNISDCEFRNIQSKKPIKGNKLIVNTGYNYDSFSGNCEDKHVLFKNCIFSSCINYLPSWSILPYAHLDSIQLQDCQFKNSCSEY